MFILSIHGLRKIFWFVQTEIKSLSFFSPPWHIHCWVSPRTGKRQNATLYKVIEGSCLADICGDRLFFVQATEALSYKEKPCKVLEWPHRKDSFRTWAFCRGWFLMTQYRKFTMKNATKEISISLNASNFQFWSLKWKKMLKGNKIGGFISRMP